MQGQRSNVQLFYAVVSVLVLSNIASAMPVQQEQSQSAELTDPLNADRQSASVYPEKRSPFSRFQPQYPPTRYQYFYGNNPFVASSLSEFAPQQQQPHLAFNKRRFAMGMPNLLHIGMNKRQFEELNVDKRRIGMNMPNILYMRSVDKRPLFGGDES